MRGEREISEQIQLGRVGSSGEKYCYFNVYKVYSTLSKMKGYCTLCKKNLRMKSYFKGLLEAGFWLCPLKIELKSRV
jgi:hypothetical protein